MRKMRYGMNGTGLSLISDMLKKITILKSNENAPPTKMTASF